MTATVSLDISGSLACVTLSHAGKFNAVLRAMWCALRSVFETVQQDQNIRCVVIFRGLATVLPAQPATNLIANAYAYADAPEHREGVMAFIEKRQPRFGCQALV